METGQHRHSASIDVAGPLGDIGHQLIDRMGQRFHVAGFTADGQSIRLIVDGDADCLALVFARVFALIRGIHADALLSAYDPLIKSICPSSFSMRTRACLRWLRRSSN